MCVCVCVYVCVSNTYIFPGAVIVFTGLLSVAFLGRKIKWFQWIGILIVIVGLVIVGVSDFIGTTSSSSGYTTNGIITGVWVCGCKVFFMGVYVCWM